MKHLSNFELFEGKTMRASKSKDNDVKKMEFKEKVESFIKSLDSECEYKTVGKDLEVNKEGVKVQIMFRDDYMGIKKSNNKFPKEFSYKELGKLKKELKDILL